MFLTRMQLNARRRGTARLLSSRQAMHAAVLASFPDPTPGADGRVLWRLDTVGEKLLLIISSPFKPDLTHVVEQAGWPTLDAAWESRDYSTLLRRVENGQRWAFRLVANPTHALAPEPGARRGRVVAHRTVAHQMEWLERQASRHGFVLSSRASEHIDLTSGESGVEHTPTARVSGTEVVRFVREGRTVTLRIAEFDGLLEVTDADALRKALTHGIGPARAYGCGMLTLAPVAG